MCCICRRFIRSARATEKVGTTRPRPNRATRQPMGHRLGRGRPHCDPSGAREPRGLLSLVAAASTASRSPSTSRSRRRPTIRTRRSTRSGSGADRTDDPVRREPAEEIPGHLPIRLRDRRLARASAELRGVFQFWLDQGVRIFRVDNPHTKPFAFWDWLIDDVKRDYPETIFLAEAFTRPNVLYRLAKTGFTQSYNYFPWRNTKEELTEYLTELTQTDVREFFGANLWPNTPDILPEYLQFGGRPAFETRFLLAATLGTSYGIYGPVFEQAIDKPLAPGKEEYLDSREVRDHGHGTWTGPTRSPG